MGATEGQVFAESTGAFRNYQRVGCGSTPAECGLSKIKGGVLGNVTECHYQELDNMPIQVIDTVDGNKVRQELVKVIYCGVNPGSHFT